MVRLLLSLFGIILMMLPAAASNDLPTKWWKTLIQGKLPIVVHFSSSSEGALYSPLQSPDSIPLTSLNITPDSVFFEIAPLRFSFKGKRNDSEITGVLTQGIQLFITFTPATPDDAKVARPQTPVPPFPYQVIDNVVIATSDSTHLGATITRPFFMPPAGAVVLVTGSGPQNRDEELFGHKPFAVLADHLTRRGWLVLRYDDRGVGKSSPGSPDDTTLDFASDAEAALRHLRTMPDLQNKPFGIIGHSEGGTIAFINASRHPELVDFVVSLAGPAVNGIDLIIEQNRMIGTLYGQEPNAQQLTDLRTVFTTVAREGRVTQALTDSISPILQRLGRKDFNLAALTPWYIAFLNLDPSKFIPSIKCPVLAINGEADVQVSARPNLEAIETMLPQARTVSMPGINHMMQEVPSPSQAMDYAGITQTFSPRALAEIVDFLSTVLSASKQ